MEHLPEILSLMPHNPEKVDDGNAFGGSEIVYSASIPGRASNLEKRIPTETMVHIFRPRMVRNKDGISLVVGLKLQTQGLHREDADLLDELSFTIVDFDKDGSPVFVAAGRRNGPLIGDPVGDWVFPNNLRLFGYNDVMKELSRFASAHPEINFEIIALELAKILQGYLQHPLVDFIQNITHRQIYGFNLFEKGKVDSDIHYYGHERGREIRIQEAKKRETGEWYVDAVLAAIRGG